jgi:3-isopropylmalate dehydrogenase
MARRKIAVIGGDGIGPEVIAEAVLVLEGYAARGLPIDLWHLDLGAERYLRDGTTLPDELYRGIEQECCAILLGALGDARVPDFEHARAILFGLRFGLDLYANVRPVRALSDALVPLRDKSARDVDFVVFRENTEGIYAGIGGQLRRNTPDEVAINEDINTRKGVERILVAGFEQARRTSKKRLHMADKSNAMRHAHELWLRVFGEVEQRYPDVTAEHIYVDALCMSLVRDPKDFDVIVTNNLFGDIVSDLGAALQGGPGMAPSASLHPGGGQPGLFEPVHGSAPELAGKGLANPFAAILSVALLLGELGYFVQKSSIERAVARALDAGRCTPDVGGDLGTAEAGRALRELLFSST